MSVIYPLREHGENTMVKNNTELEIVELFRNEGTGRIFIHLRNPEKDLITSHELVDLPEDHSTSYRARTCPDCGTLAPHPSGLCGDGYQAILEVEKENSPVEKIISSDEATRREFSRRF